MPNNSSESVERLVETIAAYVASNPHAADTLAGIQSWWLSGAPRSVIPADLEAAIRLLVQRGTLQCRRLPGGTQIYARSPQDAAHE